jgi:general secretion pathway protein K
MRFSASERCQRGTALLLVLWSIALMTIVLGGFVVVARTENLQARHLFDTTRARYAAEAGISRAVLELRRNDPLTRWVPDGRAYEIDFEGTKVEIALTDESGKLDLNIADEVVMIALFQAVGIEVDRARALSDAIQDWRDPDDLVRPLGAEIADYEAAGLEYGPPNIGFRELGEVQQVLGMSYELFEKLRPHVTVYSRMPRPNPAFASTTVIAALPGMTPDLALQLVLQRREMTPQQLGATPLTLPDGTPLVMGGGGVTYTVKSKATLPNGAWTVVDATLRLGGLPGGRAYTVLRWREGSDDVDAIEAATADANAGVVKGT